MVRVIFGLAIFILLAVTPAAASAGCDSPGVQAAHPKWFRAGGYCSIANAVEPWHNFFWSTGGGSARTLLRHGTSSNGAEVWFYSDGSEVVSFNGVTYYYHRVPKPGGGSQLIFDRADTGFHF